MCKRDSTLFDTFWTNFSIFRVAILVWVPDHQHAREGLVHFASQTCSSYSMGMTVRLCVEGVAPRLCPHAFCRGGGGGGGGAGAGDEATL